MTYTKYCTKCAKIVKDRNMNERREKVNNKNICERCGVEPKWSETGTSKYCYECKVIVQKEISKTSNTKTKQKVPKKRVHKKTERATKPKTVVKKNRNLYEDHHLGMFSKEEIENFKYSILVRDCTKAAKGFATKTRYKEEDRVSGSEKLARRKGINSVNKLILTLKSGSSKDILYGQELALEKEYVTAYEKQLLILMIEEQTGLPVGGSYTLAEAGDILGVSRERSRQIEAAAEKVLKQPSVARQLKDMIYD